MPPKRPKHSPETEFRTLPIRRLPFDHGTTCSEIELRLVCTLGDHIGHGKMSDPTLHAALARTPYFSGSRFDFYVHTAVSTRRIDRTAPYSIFTTTRTGELNGVATGIRDLARLGVFRVTTRNLTAKGPSFDLRMTWAVTSSERLFTDQEFVREILDDPVYDRGKRLLEHAKKEIEMFNLAVDSRVASVLAPHLYADVIRSIILPYIEKEVLYAPEAPVKT